MRLQPANDDHLSTLPSSSGDAGHHRWIRQSVTVTVHSDLSAYGKHLTLSCAAAVLLSPSYTPQPYHTRSILNNLNGLSDT
jgi:hypothetical protein